MLASDIGEDMMDKHLNWSLFKALQTVSFILVWALFTVGKL